MDEWERLKPTHNQIQIHCLHECPEMIAMETPVTDPDLFLRGHIDLIGIDSTAKPPVYYAIDYKPEGIKGENYEFITSLPQVSMYGILLQDIVGKDAKVRCVSYSKDYLWIYDPTDIRERLPALIKPYIKSEDNMKYPWIPLSKGQSIGVAELPPSRIIEFVKEIAAEMTLKQGDTSMQEAVDRFLRIDTPDPKDILKIASALKEKYNVWAEVKTIEKKLHTYQPISFILRDN